MGFFNTLATAFRGRQHEKEALKNEVVSAPASLGNLKVGAFVEFGFLPNHDQLSKTTKEITGIRSFVLLDNEVITYAELDDGDFYLRKEGKKVEVLQEFENNDDFIESVDEQFMDVLELEDDEWEYKDEDETSNVDDRICVVVNNQTEYEVTSAIGWAKVGVYRTVQDVMSAKIDGKRIRYIRSKSSDGSSYISVYYVNGGETFISSSTLLNKSDVDFVG